MSDHELERLRRQRLAQLGKRFLTEGKKKEEGNKQNVLKRVFVDRAWEVFNATQTQYPEIAEKLRNILVQLASSGKITHVCGQELYYLLRKMGVRVRLKTTIRIKEHGRLKSLSEKMREKPWLARLGIGDVNMKTERLTDLCGCVWEMRKGFWVCVRRCPKYSKPKSRRPFRPKAESVRSGGKFD